MNNIKSVDLVADFEVRIVFTSCRAASEFAQRMKGELEPPELSWHLFYPDGTYCLTTSKKATKDSFVRAGYTARATHGSRVETLKAWLDLYDRAHRVCESLEHPTRSVDALQMSRLREALEAARPHRTVTNFQEQAQASDQLVQHHMQTAGYTSPEQGEP